MDITALLEVVVGLLEVLGPLMGGMGGGGGGGGMGSLGSMFGS